MEPRENVVLGFFNGREFPCIEHVEDVHHHEGLEQQGIVLHAVSSFTRLDVSELAMDQVVLDAEDSGAKVQKSKHHDPLVNDLGENCSHHNGRDDVVLLHDSFLAALSWVRSFSSQSDGGQKVHDEVDPEKLDHTEGALSNSDGGD